MYGKDLSDISGGNDYKLYFKFALYEPGSWESFL